MLAVWFIASLMGAAVHHCPVHDAMPTMAAAHMHHRAAHAPAAAPEHEQSHDHHGACSCMGQCCAAAPAVIAASTVALFEARIARPARPALPNGAELTVHAAPHTLPFANGPPPALRA
jgi:hypothetical protein